jgi:hypothetical protein
MSEAGNGAAKTCRHCNCWKEQLLFVGIAIFRSLTKCIWCHKFTLQVNAPTNSAIFKMVYELGSGMTSLVSCTHANALKMKIVPTFSWAMFWPMQWFNTDTATEVSCFFVMLLNNTKIDRSWI